MLICLISKVFIASVAIVSQQFKRSTTFLFIIIHFRRRCTANAFSLDALDLLKKTLAFKHTFRVSFAIYKNGDFFTEPLASSSGNSKTSSSLYTNSAVNSLVVSGTIGGLKIANLTEPILVVVQLIQAWNQKRTIALIARV